MDWYVPLTVLPAVALIKEKNVEKMIPAWGKQVDNKLSLPI